MLALSSCQQIHLTPSRRQRARILALHAEQDQFRDVAEVEAHATAIRAAVFANLVPDKVGLVEKAPSLHDCQSFRQQCVWAPQIKMRFEGRYLAHRKRFDVLKPQGVIARKALVLGGNFSSLVGELPGRIGEHCCKPASASEAKQIKSQRMHKFLPLRELPATLGLPITAIL